MTKVRKIQPFLTHEEMKKIKLSPALQPKIKKYVSASFCQLAGLRLFFLDKGFFSEENVAIEFKASNK